MEQEENLMPTVSRKEERLKALIAKNQSGSIYGGWLTKYQHIERLGNSEVSGLIDGKVVIQEKLDGSNLTVARDPEDGSLIVCTRGRCIFSHNTAHGEHHGAGAYVTNHPGIKDLFVVYPHWILRGEWLIRHTVSYDKESYGKFYVFDVQVRKTEGEDSWFEYLPFSEYAHVLSDYGINFIPLLAELEYPKVEDLVTWSQGQSAYGPNDREGIVIKRYDFVNQFGNIVWAKIVSADFKEKHKLNGGATSKDLPEVRFASLFITKHFVLKEIEKIKEAHGDINIRMMPEVLGRVWYTVFQEELWNFVKKERIIDFNFPRARKCVETATREIALAYFNGILEDSVQLGGGARRRLEEKE